MNKSKAKRRAYSSAARTEAAGETRARILASAQDLFGERGIDAVTIAEIGDKSGVAGYRFQSARQSLAGIKDPVEAIARTSHVARAIYESESSDLGLLRNVSGFSPALRKIALQAANHAGIHAEGIADGLELLLIALADGVAGGQRMALPDGDEFRPETEANDGDVELFV